MFNHWILGMNARNLLYIKKFNPKKAIRLADNKIKTKNFFQERGIPVPETYAVINNRNELYNFDFASLPKKNFVVKPNKWSKWRWIFVTKLLEDLPEWYSVQQNTKCFFEKYLGIKKSSDYNYYYKTGGEVVNDDVYRRYLVDILDGKHSMTLWGDKILIEEKLSPGDNFKRFCQYWLADIRVIVFNLIPVAAMVRVPTIESWWKANLAQWWIWFWVEVGSGKIKSMYYKWQIFKKKFPWAFEDFQNKKLPFWNDILLYSSKIQYFVNLGYLALDWVAVKDQPKLLEVNAKAGLEVQTASVLWLRKRLEKISDVSVNSPEKWVEISKSLFNSSRWNLVAMWKVLYLSQKANIILESEEWDQQIPVVVRVDIKKEKNYISSNLYETVQEHNLWDTVLDIYESEIRLKNPVFQCSDKLKKNEIVLWHPSVSEFYIKPIHNVIDEINIISDKNILDEEKEYLYTIDQQLKKIQSKLNITKLLKPINYLDELDNFITWNWNYNPKFVYDWPSTDRLQEIEDWLKKLKENYFNENFWLKSNFAWLFEEKINELEIVLNLINSYKREKYSDILKYNEMLYWKMEDEILQLSKQKIFMDEPSDDEVLWEYLTFSQTKKIIKKYLDERWITGVRIQVDPSSYARISIVRWKKITIKLSGHAKFRQKEIYSTLAHEIDVHLRRYLNWLKTWWNILANWTWFYIKDEEWLAVYKSIENLPEDYFKVWIYKKYYLLNQAQKHSFSRLVDMIRWLENRTLNWAFKTALRAKKWVQNTWFVDWWAIFMKDKIYLDWYMKIKDWIENWWDVEQFMKWKIKIDDMSKIF